MRDASNERLASDKLEPPCWNRETVVLGFALDCHDRECLAWVAKPRDASPRPREAAVQWLSDNGGIYTTLSTVGEAKRLGLFPVTTPAYSPDSNAISHAFVDTLKRDYRDGADLASAAAVLAQIRAWIDDYNTIAPYSALSFRSPRQYRVEAAPKGAQLRVPLSVSRIGGSSRFMLAPIRSLSPEINPIETRG